MANPSIEVMILITGITVVFFVLIVLTFIIKLFGILISKINFKISNRRVKTINDIDCINKEIENEDIIPDEIIAAISAVICDLYGGSNGKGVVFKSIRRINNKSNNMWRLRCYSKDITDIFN